MTSRPTLGFALEFEANEVEGQVQSGSAASLGDDMTPGATPGASVAADNLNDFAEDGGEDS
jgi:hypothetical protein